MLKTNIYLTSYLNIINEDVQQSSNGKCFAIRNKVKYDSNTNTIDCLNQYVRFKNSDFDQNGTFNFKLINLSDDFSEMFKDCTLLRQLPDDFIIPDNVINYTAMFDNCKSLQQLPDNFILPDNANNCNCMFRGCTSLQQLPANFIIPNGTGICDCMFWDCNSLTHLPDNFTLPDSVTNCEYMFWDCSSLKQLPEGFTIPEDCYYDCLFVGTKFADQEDQYVTVKI